MYSNKSFRTSLIGSFKKKDVSSYIEKIYSEFELKLKEKDERISKLKDELKNIALKYDTAKKSINKVSDDRDKIADVLIKAQEKADSIIEESQKKALEDKEIIEELVKIEKDKLERVKTDLKKLKEVIHLKIREYELQIDDIIGEETIEDIIVNNSEILGKL